MPVGRGYEHLAWAGSLVMALIGCIVLLSGDSDAAAADAPAATPASTGTGTGPATTVSRTLVEAESHHRVLRAKCQRLPVAATVAECQRHADRQLALDRARLLPPPGASRAGSPRPP